MVVLALPRRAYPRDTGAAADIPLNGLLGTNLKSVAVAAFALSVVIEALQFGGRWLGSPRTDIDDVLLSVVGALIGYGLIRMVQAGAMFTRLETGLILLRHEGSYNGVGRADRIRMRSSPV